MVKIIEKRQLGSHRDERGILLWASPTLLKFDYKYLTIGSIEPGCKRGGHYHKETLEQFLCISGKITYFRDNAGSDRQMFPLRKHNEKITLEAGDIVDVPLGTVHTFVNEGEEPAHFIEFKSVEVRDGKEDVYRKDN